MNIYNVIYGVGDVCGGYNRAMVATTKKEHLQGMLNEQEGDEVLLASIQLVA